MKSRLILTSLLWVWILVVACGLVAPTPASTPTPTPTSTPAVHELEVIVEPQEAADYILNPKPDAQGAYTAGTTVTIDVLPKEGWRIEKWVGPAYDVAEESARVDMDSSHMVAVRLIPKEAPTPTPTPALTSTPRPAPTPIIVVKEVIKEVIKEVPVEVVVEKKVIKEVVKEVPKVIVVEKEVIKEVTVEVVVEKKVIKEVVKEVVVVATPTPAPVPPQGVARWVSDGANKHYRGDFPLLASSNPGFWDVHYGGSLTTTLAPSGPRFNQLVEYNPVNTTEIIGDLAKSWEVNTKGDEYIFHLHDADWSDGRPVTADDIKFSLDRITEPGALRARTGILSKIYQHRSATIIDDKTIKVPLLFPAAAFLPNLASDYMKMYPKHVVENLAQDDMNCCPEKYFGSGPYIFRSWKKDGEYTFDRNPNYFKAPRPFFDGLHVFIVRQTSRRQAALAAGQAFGLYPPITGLPGEWAPLERDTNGRIRLLVLPAEATQVFFVNGTRPPFDDPRVRRALFLGINRPDVARAAFGEFATPGTFFAANYVEQLDRMGNVPGWRINKQQDFADAKVLLAEAGYPDGFKVTLNTLSTGTTAQMAEAVRFQLQKDLNIDLQLSAKDLASANVALRDGTNELTLIDTSLVLKDPGDIISQFFDQDILRNPHNWSDRRSDWLMMKQHRELDPAERRALIGQMVDVLREGESHIVPIAWYDWGGALDYRIRNYSIPPTIQLVHKWDHVWFDPIRPMPTRKGYVP